MEKHVQSSSLGMIPNGGEGGDGADGGTGGVVVDGRGGGSCGSTSPFSAADYAILQNHHQHHPPRPITSTPLPMLGSGPHGSGVGGGGGGGGGGPHDDGNYHSTTQQTQQYVPRYPISPEQNLQQPYLEHQLNQAQHHSQQNYHQYQHHGPQTQNMQQHQHLHSELAVNPPSPRHQNASNPLHHNTGSRPAPVTATSTPAATPQSLPPPSTPWTLGSTDGSYAVSRAMMMEQQQLLEGTEVDGGGGSNGPIPDLSVSTLGMGTQSSAGGGGLTSPNSPLQQSSQPQSQQQAQALLLATAQKSLYQDRLLRQTSAAVESVLAASCEVMGFDIAELWVRTGHKTHQLTNSHLRPTALDDSVRMQLVDVYYGEKSNERTHRLSPALCKRAKEAGDVVWVTAHSATGAQALRCSISNVRTAVAVPVCHEASNTNITIIFFSVRRIIVRPTSVEFLVHMSLAAGVASVNSLAEDGHENQRNKGTSNNGSGGGALVKRPNGGVGGISQSEHVPSSSGGAVSSDEGGGGGTAALVAIRHPRVEKYSVTGAQLDLQWRQLANVEYLTDGGNSWIHTAVFNGKEIVVKTLKPECQDVALAINEIESELSVHSRLNHVNIVSLIGAGTTSKGVRFFVLERLDGGTLSQMLGYGTRIRDRRRRFWKKKRFSFLDVLRIGKAIAEAMTYCHEDAIPGSVVMHRDLKPDNIGFTLDGTVKLLDFGLAKIVENASVDSDEVYAMSGETGSLRYMSPETASSEPYNFTADVYSFGIILWELNSMKKPFDGLSRDQFYERVVYGGERPPLSRKWPSELTSLMSECWDADMHNRPKFRDIVERLDVLLEKEKGGAGDPGTKKQFLPKISGMIDRHSTWF